MKYIPLFLLCTAASLCQPVSIGVKLGVPLDPTGGALDNRTSVEKQRWIVGPTLEVRISSHFTAGVDALYRRLGYETVRNVGSASFFEKSTTAHWEVPIYLKYRLGQGPIRPFAVGGGAFEHAGVAGTAGCTGDALLCGEMGVGTHELRSSSWGGGYLFGGGIEFWIRKITFAPEFRYTRWVRGYFAGASSDEPALLLGIRF